MRPESAYYDTCIFLEALNRSHPESKHCSHLLDVRHISWIVVVSHELSRAESTAEEFIEKFEIACVSQGVDFIGIPLSAIRNSSRKYHPFKRWLTQRGFSSRDWKHLMSAVTGSAKTFVSVDPDYWDPRNKAIPHASSRSDDVKREIERRLPLEVRLPSEVLACC